MVEWEAAERARETRREARWMQKTTREQAKAAHHAQRQDQYQQVQAMREQGLSSSEIAPRVGISARTVRQWLADGVDPKPRRRRASPLDAYVPYLRRRWEEGQTGEGMYAELQARGYTGSIRAVYRYLSRWRPPRQPHEKPAPVTPRPKRHKHTALSPGPFDDCQAKQAVWLYLRSPEELTAAEQEQVIFIQQVHPSLEMAYCLVQEFVTMMRKREGACLEAWLAKIHTCQILELIRFGNGIERDPAPVQAALTLSYSNGVVEGHVHRLKLIKRQGYGRAAFPLLRKRVLYQAC